MLTNYGLLDIVIDTTTGRARKASGACATARVGNREAADGKVTTNTTKGVPVLTPARSPYRSKLERAFAEHLVYLRIAGLLTAWSYEPLNLRLPGKKNFYKPDFLVQDSHGLTFYEVKGRNKSDERSLVKIKTAAGLNPWARFIWVTQQKGEWIERIIES